MPDNDGHIKKLKEIPFPPSRIENIDTAMLSYLEGLNLHTTTNNGWTPLPVIWASAERVYQSKRDSRVRDKDGSLVLPLMTVERTSLVKDPSKKGTIQAALVPESDKKAGVILVARRIKQDKTSNFANADAQRKRGQPNFPTVNKKVVYESITIPLPVYITLNYEITIRTEYQQQMNEIMVPFITSPGGINYIIISDEHHRYEGFIQQDFSHNNNLSSFSNEERKFETKMNIEVLGHLIGSGKDEMGPNITIRENPVEFKIPRERVMTQDEVEREIGEFIGRQNLPGWSDA